jgi:hypothetical protein
LPRVPHQETGASRNFAPVIADHVRVAHSTGYNSFIMQLNISPCSHSAIHLHGYERTEFPEFVVLFETPSSSSPLRYFCRDSEEAFLSVILENHGEKAITALRYQWITIDASGERRTHTSFGDSYAVDVFRAIAEPRSRHLLSPSGSVDEALLTNVLAGGGFIGCVSAGKRPWTGIVEAAFEIQLILFGTAKSLARIPITTPSSFNPESPRQSSSPGKSVWPKPKPATLSRSFRLSRNRHRLAALVARNGIPWTIGFATTPRTSCAPCPAGSMA